MKTIWKYPLKIMDQQLIGMPKGAEVLSVIAQGDTPTLYALVDPSESIIPRQVRIYGTGNPFRETDGSGFVGTVTTNGGSLVWHVFVRMEVAEREPRLFGTRN